MTMLDMKLLQSIGNQAAHAVELRYPRVQINFFALRNGRDSRVFLAQRGDTSGRTGRLTDLGELPETGLDAVRDVTAALETRIEKAVREFLQLDAAQGG
jgi:hypothetical protein